MKHHLGALRLAAVFAAALTTAIGNQARAAVTWSFFETGISCFQPSCFLPTQPYVFMTLTLPGPTSSGTADWDGGPTTPVFTGDFFELRFPFPPGRLNPDFVPAPIAPICVFICGFHVSWSETDGRLVGVAINVDAFNDNIGGQAGGPFGLTGGRIASDAEGRLGGCVITLCEVTGFWQSDLAVPEPSTATLVLVGLFGAWFARRKFASRAA